MLLRLKKKCYVNFPPFFSPRAMGYGRWSEPAKFRHKSGRHFVPSVTDLAPWGAPAPRISGRGRVLGISCFTEMKEKRSNGSGGRCPSLSLCCPPEWNFLPLGGEKWGFYLPVSLFIYPSGILMLQFRCPQAPIWFSDFPPFIIAFHF